MPWDIIFWDNCVDYVPDSWAANKSKTKYYWPTTKKMHIQKLILMQSKPDVQNWTVYNAEYKRTVQTIEEALAYLQESAYASNLDSSSEFEKNVKRKRKQSDSSSLSQSDSEDELENLATDAHTRIDNDRCGQFQQFGDLRKKNIEVNQVQKENINAKPFNYKSMPEEQFNVASVSGSYPLASSHSDTIFKEKVLTLLEELKFGQKNIIKKLESFSAANIAIKLTTTTFDFPITADEELNKIERRIQEKENFDSLVKELLLIGGSNEKQATQLIMKRILNKEMSLLYSILGRKGKRAFNKLKICEAVIRAVQSRFNGATEDSILKYMSSILATAADREGGRKFRTKQN